MRSPHPSRQANGTAIARCWQGDLESSSREPAVPPGLLPAFSLPVFPPCLTTPEPRCCLHRCNPTAARGGGRARASSTAGCSQEDAVSVLEGEVGPVSLYHRASPELEQLASQKAAVPPTKQKEKW